MIGTILFWLQYIVAVICLYHITNCIYVKGNKQERSRSYNRFEYSRTDQDKKLKHPLWLLIIFFAVLLIPILNIIVFVSYLLHRTCCEDGEDYNPYYCKSVFTNKY